VFHLTFFDASQLCLATDFMVFEKKEVIAMAKERYLEKLCKLKDATVGVLEQANEELGRDGVIDWHIMKCLNQDANCNKLDCKFVRRGIGDTGSQDPFE